MEPWIHIESEAIDGCRYDRNEHMLRVRFVSGKVYDYKQASPELYQEFLHADSKGQFFSHFIRDQLPFRKVH